MILVWEGDLCWLLFFLPILLFLSFFAFSRCNTSSIWPSQTLQFLCVSFSDLIAGSEPIAVYTNLRREGICFRSRCVFFTFSPGRYCIQGSLHDSAVGVPSSACCIVRGSLPTEHAQLGYSILGHYGLVLRISCIGSVVFRVLRIRDTS